MAQRVGRSALGRGDKRGDRRISSRQHRVQGVERHDLGGRDHPAAWQTEDDGPRPIPIGPQPGGQAAAGGAVAEGERRAGRGMKAMR